MLPCAVKGPLHTGAQPRFRVDRTFRWNSADRFRGPSRPVALPCAVAPNPVPVAPWCTGWSWLRQRRCCCPERVRWSRSRVPRVRRSSAALPVPSVRAVPLRAPGPGAEIDMLCRDRHDWRLSRHGMSISSRSADLSAGRRRRTLRSKPLDRQVPTSCSTTPGRAARHRGEPQGSPSDGHLLQVDHRHWCGHRAGGEESCRPEGPRELHRHRPDRGL